jgi:hypothetical protein
MLLRSNCPGQTNPISLVIHEKKDTTVAYVTGSGHDSMSRLSQYWSSAWNIKNSTSNSAEGIPSVASKFISQIETLIFNSDASVSL